VAQLQYWSRQTMVPAAAVDVPLSVAERSSAVFFGRYAGNVDTMSKLADQIPGTSGEAFEAQVFGVGRPRAGAKPRGRYPFIATRFPVNAVRFRARLAAVRAETATWWSGSVFPAPPSGPAATALLIEAQRRFARCMRAHIFATFLAQGMFDQVCRLARQAGAEGLETELVTGYGGLEESALAGDLGRVAADELPLEGFLRRHGFHGPGEGELSGRSWREDRRPVEDLLAGYRLVGSSQSIATTETQQAAVRRGAEAKLLAALPASRRPSARLALRLARACIPMREVGKGAFLRAVDVGRAAARAIGDDLVSQGLLDDRDDVFHLTVDELVHGLPGDARAEVAHRRATRGRYLTMTLPARWVGNAEPLPIDGARTPDDAGPLEGLPVSGGMVEGRARVIHDAAVIADFEPGDVLVCETTDPSWTLLFHLAGAVVIDIGGPLSHGAIVARELGIPGVMNTKTGTSRIGDGDWVRVDGSAGRVEILKRSEGKD